MSNAPTRRRSPQLELLKICLVGLGVTVCLLLLVYRPDRPVKTIAPASSTEPAFVVQIVRPRMGLPLGGLLPPQLFGLEGHLGFDSESSNATIDSQTPGLIKLSADDWELVLVLDSEGQVTKDTHIVFQLMFEGRIRRIRCSPGLPVTGTFKQMTLDSGELSGSFDIELSQCNDAETGKPLGWPPKPFVLHGSFDRLQTADPAGKTN